MNFGSSVRKRVRRVLAVCCATFHTFGTPTATNWPARRPSSEVARRWSRLSCGSGGSWGPSHGGPQHQAVGCIASRVSLKPAAQGTEGRLLTASLEIFRQFCQTAPPRIGLMNSAGLFFVDKIKNKRGSSGCCRSFGADQSEPRASAG